RESALVPSGTTFLFLICSSAERRYCQRQVSSQPSSPRRLAGIGSRLRGDDTPLGLQCGGPKRVLKEYAGTVGAGALMRPGALAAAVRGLSADATGRLGGDGGRAGAGTLAPVKLPRPLRDRLAAGWRSGRRCRDHSAVWP